MPSSHPPGWTAKLSRGTEVLGVCRELGKMLSLKKGAAVGKAGRWVGMGHREAVFIFKEQEPTQVI